MAGRRGAGPGRGTGRTCKPGFVPHRRRRRGDDHFSRTPVTRRLWQPTRGWDGTGRSVATLRPTPPCLALLPMGFTKPDRSPGPLVSSYLTVSPLPAGFPAGGLFSVALSLTLRPVGVTHHRALRSPDFPPVRAFPPGSSLECPVDSPDRRPSVPPRSLSREPSPLTIPPWRGRFFLTSHLQGRRFRKRLPGPTAPRTELERETYRVPCTAN